MFCGVLSTGITVQQYLTEFKQNLNSSEFFKLIEAIYYVSQAWGWEPCLPQLVAPWNHSLAWP